MFRPCCFLDGGKNLLSIPVCHLDRPAASLPGPQSPALNVRPHLEGSSIHIIKLEKLETSIHLGRLHSVHPNHKTITHTSKPIKNYLYVFFFRLGLTCSWFQVECQIEVELGMFRGSSCAARWLSGLHTQAQTPPRSPQQPFSAVVNPLKTQEHSRPVRLSVGIGLIVYTNCRMLSRLF